MEICLVIFLIGLVCSVIKVLWEFVVGHWHSVVVLLVLAIGAVVVIAMIPEIKKAQEAKKRRAELAKIEERRLLDAKEEELARAKEKQELLHRAEEKRLSELRQIREREDKIRTFAMNESPVLWQAYQELGGSIEIQTRKVADLKQDLIDFGRSPDDDQGFKRNVTILEEMNTTHETIRKKLEDAYLAYRAFEALPERGKEKAQGCIKEAEDVLANYRRLIQPGEENKNK